MKDLALNNGFHAVGIFHAFKSIPWSNDATKFNHRILLANPFEDANGFQQTEVISIDISYEDVARVKELESSHKGKQVIIPCRLEARKGGKSGAWLSRFMPKGSLVTMLNKAF